MKIKKPIHISVYVSLIIVEGAQAKANKQCR